MKKPEFVVIYSTLVLFLDVLCFEDLIIERKPHHVDWEDMFMEYNRYSAPNREKQEINVTIEVTDFQGNEVLFEMNQKWRDERLRFVGQFRAPVPSHINPWIPDTYIRNGFNTKTEKSSLSLNYDGSFLLREKYQIRTEETLERPFTIVISSLNNYGANMIHYNVVSWKISAKPSPYNHAVAKNIGRKFDDLHFEDTIITFGSNNSTDF